jgi:hypothetical protein
VSNAAVAYLGLHFAECHQLQCRSQRLTFKRGHTAASCDCLSAPLVAVVSWRTQIRKFPETKMHDRQIPTNSDWRHQQNGALSTTTDQSCSHISLVFAYALNILPLTAVGWVGGR